MYSSLPWLALVQMYFAMAIPNSLIPSDEKKPINKKRLIFAISVTTIFAIPLMVGIFSGLISMLKSPPEDEKIFAIGLLSAFKCQLDKGNTSPEKGQTILKEIASKHGFDNKIFENSDLTKAANFYSKTLDETCSSTVRDEKKAIIKIYHSKIK